MPRLLISNHLPSPLVFLILLLLSGCGKPAGYVSFQPSGIPMSVSVNSKGEVSLSLNGEATYPTPLGVFTVGVILNPADHFNVANTLIVRIVDENDRIYDLHGNDFNISLESGYYRQLSLHKDGRNLYLELERGDPLINQDQSSGGHGVASRKRETLTVDFRDGVSESSTEYEYSGTVTIVAEGKGQAAGTQWSDAFYVYTDGNGLPVAPWHPTENYNWSLWINGEQADSTVESTPPYNSSHVYSFPIYTEGGRLTFAVGDTATSDNDGYFTITIFQ